MMYKSQFQNIDPHDLFYGTGSHIIYIYIYIYISIIYNVSNPNTFILVYFNHFYYLFYNQLYYFIFIYLYFLFVIFYYDLFILIYVLCIYLFFSTMCTDPLSRPLRSPETPCSR